ncbi:MAG TPA: dienelactone hydrolase family protein [Polyangiaceae bacterium]|nr:dienelactone hydrolase family protein [Polyangiaceae bacterium]
MKTETLEYAHGGVTFIGELSRPDTDGGARPGILVVHEGTGITEHAKRRARELAERGFVALAADMFGGGSVAPSLVEGRPRMMALRGDLELLRARVNAGLTALRAQPGVDAKRLAAIGFCFGGMCVLELARSGADVQGVVSFHGILRTDRPAGPGDIKGKVLACHGAADPFVSAEEVAVFQKELSEAGVDWHLLVNGGAGHGFTNPGASNLGVPGVAYDQNAERRSFAAMYDFFDALFGAP